MKILLIEDDPVITQVIKLSLKEKNFSLDVYKDGREGLTYAMANCKDYAIIILDIILPGINGLEICKKLRSTGCQTPILMLSARDKVEHKVQGLEVGADDYIAKPFVKEEFTARINALLRRKEKQYEEAIKVNDLKISEASQMAYVKNLAIELTKLEFRLLHTLMKNKNQVVQRDRLVNIASESQFRQVSSNSLNVHINSIRNKLVCASKEKGCQMPKLKTLRGVGYSLQEAQ